MESSSAGVLEVDLADLVVPKQVAVVQELDLGKLSATLQAIVDAVNSRAAAGQDDAPTKGDFEALQKELEKLRQDVDGKDAEIKELKAEQVCTSPPSHICCWIGLGFLLATFVLCLTLSFESSGEAHGAIGRQDWQGRPGSQGDPSPPALKSSSRAYRNAEYNRQMVIMRWWHSLLVPFDAGHPGRDEEAG